VVEKSGSPRQQTTVRLRENRVNDPRKAAVGLRLRAGLAASNRVWELNPWLPVVRFPVAVESADAQNRYDELPRRLLA